MSKTPRVDKVMHGGTVQNLADVARDLEVKLAECEAKLLKQLADPENPNQKPDLWRACAEAYHQASLAKKMKDVHIALANGEELYRQASGGGQ